MSPPLSVTSDEMETALRIFAEAVAQVAGQGADALPFEAAADELHEVEAAG